MATASRNPHPTLQDAGAPPPVPALPEGKEFHFVFSNRTPNDKVCLGIRQQLVDRGFKVWQQQTNIPRDNDNWFAEWFPNAIQSDKIVCFLSASYLRSVYCMKEFRVAENRGNLLVVTLEPIPEST